MKDRIKAFFRRNSATIALSIIAFCICGIFVLQALTIASLSDQVRSQNQLLAQIKDIAEAQTRNAKQQSKQIDGVDRHLDCIVIFFSQTQRDMKSIEDINRCRIQDKSTGTSAEPETPNIEAESGEPTTSSTEPAATTTPEEPKSFDSSNIREGRTPEQETHPEPSTEEPSAFERLTQPIKDLTRRLF